MNLTGRVQHLEGVTFAIIEGLIGLGVMAQRIENAQSAYIKRVRS